MRRASLLARPFRPGERVNSGNTPNLESRSARLVCGRRVVRDDSAQLASPPRGRRSRSLTGRRMPNGALSRICANYGCKAPARACCARGPSKPRQAHVVMCSLTSMIVAMLVMACPFQGQSAAPCLQKKGPVSRGERRARVGVSGLEDAPASRRVQPRQSANSAVVSPRPSDAPSLVSALSSEPNGGSSSCLAASCAVTSLRRVGRDQTML